MGLHALGDSAWLFKANGTSPNKKLELILRLRGILKLNPIPEIVDLVSSFDTIAVHFNPVDGQRILEHLTSLRLDDAGDQQAFQGQTVTIPVVYDGGAGSDLQALADARKLDVSELIGLHRDTEYTVAAIGFSPGFPYLQGLPPQLHQPRHSSPREVPAGSVAIAGEQAGIYPFASQGGWHVIGRTDVALFDPHREQPALLQPGDKVRFVEAENSRRPVTDGSLLPLSATQPAATGQAREIATSGNPNAVGSQQAALPEAAAGCTQSTVPAARQSLDLEHVPEDAPGIHVIEPGALSSIQDHGRWGRQHLGVSPGGAADPVLASIANRLVGNPDDAAIIECTMTGPVLKFGTDARVAWVGWADEHSGKPHEIKAGESIDLRSRMCHLRGYVAVAGGIDVPEVLGSRATDLRAVLGGYHGRTLQAGDTLPIGKASTAPVSEKWHVSWPHPDGRVIEIRYLRGVQANWFTEESHRLFSGTFYEISPTFDRTGTRLKGLQLKLKEPREMVSQPVVFGSVQVPPDGQPIVLMSQRQTIGGYPQIGHVISADIPKLARAWPGTQVRFREVGLDDARHAWNELQRELGILNAGLIMKRNES